jgi:4-carboxymuconolactone decarboxylase
MLLIRIFFSPRDSLQLLAISTFQHRAASMAGIWKETFLTHKRAKDVVPTKASPDYFTGDVTLTQLLQPVAPSRVAASVASFAKGARTHWHTHPLGQTIIVTEGEGLYQLEGGPIHKMTKGDVVTFAPGVKHWHGASLQLAMTHLAIQEVSDGSAITWLEAVTDGQYKA